MIENIVGILGMSLILGGGLMYFVGLDKRWALSFLSWGLVIAMVLLLTRTLDIDISAALTGIISPILLALLGFMFLYQSRKTNNLTAMLIGIVMIIAALCFGVMVWPELKNYYQ